MQYDAIWCNMMQYDAIWCNMMQYDAIWCNMMQYDAIWCNMMQYDAILCTMMQYDAIWCTMMQYDALWCNMMQYDAIWCNMMQYDAIWCTMMQYDAIWCNMLSRNHDELGTNGRATNARLANTVILLHAAESTPAMVVIDAPTPIEEPSSNHSPCSAEAVHRAGIHWVINMQLLEEHRCGLVDKGSNQSSGKGTATFHVATACSDGDQACKDAIAESTNIILLHDKVSEHEDCDATCGCRQGRIHCHLRGQSTIRSRFHGQSRARVEAIPTKPKSESAQHNQGQVVTLELLWIGEAPLSRPQNHGAGQTAHTAREVNHSTAWDGQISWLRTQEACDEQMLEPFKIFKHDSLIGSNWI